MVLRVAVPRLCVAEPRWVYHFNPSLGGGPIHRLHSRRSDGPDGIPGQSLVSLRVAKMTDAFGVESHRIPVNEIGSLKQYKKICTYHSKTIEQSTRHHHQFLQINPTRYGTTP